MDENQNDLLSNIPFPEKGTDEAFARSLIEMVLNATLNRYFLALDDSGYTNPKALKNQGGWIEGKPGKLLQLKFDIMDEAVSIFSPEIVKELIKREKSDSEDDKI